MRRALLSSPTFVRAARRLVKKRPEVQEALQRALESLERDAFEPGLRTHKLKGALEGSWSCSVDHDLRVVFSFVRVGETEAVLLKTVGTHDEVY
jgi:addiction module RelE/StbE family toxin